MKNRKKNTKLILLLLLICITLGYAALRTGLNINGTTNVSSASWNVYFSNYQMSNATNITPTTEPSISGTTTTSISYEINLEQPGDIYEFSVEVVNGGSLDALISLVSKYNGSEIGPGNQIPAYIDYTVTDVNGDPIVDNHRLNHGNREIVKVFVKYKDDDPSILPSSNTTLSFDIEIEATQAPKDLPNIIYTIGGPVDLNESIDGTVKTYLTPEEALAKSNTYYKNVLEGEEKICAYYIDEYSGEKVYYNCDYADIEECEDGDPELNLCERTTIFQVKEIYFVFVINDVEKERIKNSYCGDDPLPECIAEFDNMVNGTYSLRVGVDEQDLSEKPIYEANKNVIKTVYNYAIQPDVCYINENTFINCPVITVDSNGELDSSLGYAICRYNSGGAYCYSDD